MKWLLVPIALIYFSFHATAQKDNNYIVQFEKPYNIQFNTWLNDYNFKINPRQLSNDGKTIAVSPNISLQSGLSFGLKYVTLAFGVQVPGTNNNEKSFGRTNYFDFGFSYYQSFFGVDIYSRSFSGAYRIVGLDTLADVRPDTKIGSYGLNLFYNFNHKKFSYRSALSLAEFQKKSSGAFLLMSNIGNRTIDADSSLIPEKNDSSENYGVLESLQYLQLWHINIRPGYAYNFCFNDGKWFISPSAFVGAGWASYQIRNLQNSISGNSFEANAHIKISTGNNHPDYFWNFFLTYDIAINTFPSNMSVANESGSFGFNIGYRFKKLIPKIKWL